VLPIPKEAREIFGPLLEATTFYARHTLDPGIGGDLTDRMGEVKQELAKLP